MKKHCNDCGEELATIKKCKGCLFHYVISVK